MPKPPKTPKVKPHFDPSTTDGKLLTLIVAIDEIMEAAGYSEDEILAFVEIASMAEDDEGVFKAAAPYVNIVSELPIPTRKIARNKL